MKKPGIYISPSLLASIFVIIFVFASKISKAQLPMQITQCAINMVKGLDSLVNPFQPKTTCNVSTINQWRTILSDNCSGPGPAPTNTRFVFNSISTFDPSEFYLHWPIHSTSNTSGFGYWGLCLITNPAYFANTPSSSVVDPNAFPAFASSTAENFVDRIKIKKIVYSLSSPPVLQDENTHNIVSIKNPRLMTPVDPFWSLVPSTNFIHHNNAAGILVDITLKDDTRYTGMLWHRYSPESFGTSAAWMMEWKSSFTCPTNLLTNFTASTLAATPCTKYQFNVTLSGANTVPSCPDITATNLYFDHGDGSPLVAFPCATNGNYTDTYTYVSPGNYNASVYVFGPGSCTQTLTIPVTITCPPPCIDCIPSFAPVPGKTYVISAWVKDQNAIQSTTTYIKPKITIEYPPLPLTTFSVFIPKGDIIDGWQRIEGEFLIPTGTSNLNLKLECSGGDCLFDDVRVFPFDGSMKSYVYDPINMRLVAELDERHYATLYEYDEEGKLIRVKKETAKGKMTIQENRNNTKK